ncbi:MAG: hypothetical protein K8F30_15060, partial [Taibaiella sp.]|nr:hypothetical protein [Taibaiella sp.]
NDNRGFATHWLKYTPFVEKDNHNVVNDIHIITQFQELNLCNCRTKTSASILITQGDKITSDNLTYISSINSLVKQSIEDMDYHRNNKSRCLYLFILVFDGKLFQLSNSDSEDVDLTEVQYGHYEFQHTFKPLPGYESISYTMRHVSPYYIIEIMTPNYFEEFINKLEKRINSIDTNKFENWGDNDSLNR